VPHGSHGSATRAPAIAPLSRTVLLFLSRQILTLFAVSAATTLAACGSTSSDRSSGSTGTPIATELAFATFDSAWSTVNRTHFDPEFEGVDWQAVRDSLRPRVADAATYEDLRGILNAMLAEIGLSHFGILAGSALDAFDGDDGDDPSRGGSAGPGITTRLVDDRVVVWRVREDSPAARAGVHPGWVVRTIDDRDLEQRLEKARVLVDPGDFELLVSQALPVWLNGAAGTTVTLEFLDGDDEVQQFEIEREVPPGVMNRFGNLPPIRVSFTDSLARAEGRDIAVLGFNIWLMPVAAPFDAAIDRHRDADGMVIDLRGNPGGIGAMAMGLAGHFMTERESLGVMSTRTNDLTFLVNPRLSNAAGERVEPFSGPVAILIDGLSMSTTEIFAQGLKVLGRVRVFGQRSPGAALPSYITRLPNGDGLQHAVADFVDPDGNRLEKSGVVPHEIVPLRRADLLAGRDAPLEAAFHWIAAESEESSARR